MAPALVAIRPMVAGVDIGSREHWVAAPPRSDGSANVRVFGTTTPQLQQLVQWLSDEGVESVALESTSVYWIPLYELLESSGVEAVLINARQLHNVPGRKTDMADCQWLQLLHSCGLLRGSFRPQEYICRLRALRRQMANLVAERTRVVQWMHKALDQMNVQVHHAVTDITGKTGMLIIRAIVGGERSPMKLASLRDRRCRESEPEIAEHLTGTWREEHLFNLSSSLALYDTLQAQIVGYESRLSEEMQALESADRAQQQAPVHPNPRKHKAMRRRGEQTLRSQLWRIYGVDLTRIDGISTGTAQLILSEFGLDLQKFPTERHFVSWLRLCPRTAISGGKPLKKKRNVMGATRIAGALRMAAVTLVRSKSALGGAYRRKSRQKGATVAVFAMARTLAQLVYRAIRYGQEYVDIGQEAYEAQFADKRMYGLRQAARSLGYTLTPSTELTAAT